jgi:hypothetical protein
MKIKGESTSVKVLPWDPFATFNVAVLIHSFVHIGYFKIVLRIKTYVSCLRHNYIIQIENRVLLSNLKKAELSLKVSNLLGKYLLQLTSGNVLPWDPF